MCDVRYTNWDRPVTDQDFAALAEEVGFDGPSRLPELVRALTGAFPAASIRPPAFIFAFIVEAFRAWQLKGRADAVVPDGVRLPLGAYVYDTRGAVTARYQTDLLQAVHEGVPRFLMSAQAVYRLNAVLARFGFVFTTGHCCEVVFLPVTALAAYLDSPLIRAREAARQRANEVGMPFRHVANASDLPPACEFGPQARQLHVRLLGLMTSLAGPITQAMQPLASGVPATEAFASA
jgi:hypothetical protein